MFTDGAIAALQVQSADSFERAALRICKNRKFHTGDGTCISALCMCGINCIVNECAAQSCGLDGGQETIIDVNPSILYSRSARCFRVPARARHVPDTVSRVGDRLLAGLAASLVH